MLSSQFKKLATCNITDNVSITNTKPIKINDNVRLSMIEIVANIPPKAKSPVSPINTLAGLMLYGKNPKSANNIMIKKPIAPNTKLMMAYIVNPIIDSPVANPSNHW